MASGTVDLLDVHILSGLYAVVPSQHVLNRSLAANTAESMTVPGTSGERYFVSFAATGDFYADFTTTAVVPGDVTNGQAPELNPGLRIVAGASTISVIAPAACIVNAAFFKGAR
jgi:hypothetical protein